MHEAVRKAQLTQRLLARKTEEADLTSVLESYQKELDAVNASIAELKKNAAGMDEQNREWKRKSLEANQKLESAVAQYHKQQSRLESLKNIAERYDGYGNSIRRVMEVRDRVHGIHGVVADLLQAEKKYETAIETALGGSIQNIVTDNEATAKYLIEYLKRGHFGRATFFPLTSMRGKKTQVNEDAARETGVLGVANALVSYDPVYEGLVAQLLGRTLVVDTIDHAIVIQRKYRQTLRMVTLEGELLSPGGSMTGGSFRNNSNLLGRRREIEELEKSVQGLAKELREIQQELEEKKNKRNEIRDLRTELNEKLQRQYIEQNTVRLNLEKAREKKTEIRLDFEALQKESLEIENQIAEIERNRKVIGQEMQESVERESTLQENIQKAQEALTGLRRREAEYTKDLEEIRLNYANLSQKDGFLAQNIRRLEEETGKLEAESRTMLEKAAEEKDDVKKKQQDIVEIQKTIAAAVQAKEEEDRRIVELQEKKEALSADHKEFFEKRDQLSDHISLMDKECFRLNSQKEKLVHLERLLADRSII